MRFIIFVVLLFQGVFCNSCEDCILTAKCLNNIAINSNTFYEKIFDFNLVENLFIDNENNFNELSLRQNNIIQDLNKICEILNTSTKFDLTTNRSCKLLETSYLRTATSIYSYLDDIKQNFCMIISYFSTPLEDNSIKYCQNIPEIIDILCPQENFLNNVNTFIDQIKSKNNLLEEKIKYLSLQLYFFQNLSMYIKYIANIFYFFSTNQSLGICINCKNLNNEIEVHNSLNLVNEKISGSVDLLYNGILVLEEIKSNELSEYLVELINRNRQLPITTKSNQKVGMIPNNEWNDIFVETENGDFLFPTYKTVWNPISMKRDKVFTFEPVIIDKNTNTILSPQKFFGMQKPNIVYIRLEDLYQDINEQTEKSFEIIDKIYKQLDDKIITVKP